MARIYVSSTYIDLRDCREKVRLVLRRLGHDDVAMEYYVAEDRRPLEKCLHDVDSCDLYLGLFAWRYGYIPPGEVTSITELEFRRASVAKKPCLIFLRQGSAPRPATPSQRSDLARVTALRDELESTHLVAFFSNGDDLQARVTEALVTWERAERRTDSDQPFQAPLLPAHHIERTLAMRAIRDALFSDAHHQAGVLVIGAIHGLPGVGKTSLAATIAHDPATIEHFKDGVLWATLGQSPDCMSALSDWIYALGDRDFRPTTVAAAASYLRTLLYRRACLLVVDDVWESEHARPFIAGGADCRLLITTRRAHIADELGAHLYPLDVMTEEEAIALLRKRIEQQRPGGALSDQDLQYAAALAEETGYLPLALELIGALVARGYSWSEAQSSLNIGQERRDGSGRSHRVRAKVEAVLRLSLNQLYAENRNAWERFALLGVLAEDAVINAAVAATLWATSEPDAVQVLNSLVDDAVLQRKRGGVGLHDLMHEMARTLLGSRPPNGLGLDMAQAHGILLQRYADHLPPHRWDLLPDDGYIHAKLFWHCAAAGDNAVARALLEQTTDDGRNSWFVARDRIGQSAGFLDDVRVAWQLELSSPKTTLSRCCRYALMLASMHSLAEAISPRLTVLLVERGVWPLEKGVERVQQVRDLYERADGLMALLASMPIASATAEPHTTSDKLRDGVIHDIRANVRQRMTGYRAARFLADLSYHLNGAEQDEVILDAVALVVADRRVLRELARYLPESARARLVDRVRQMYQSRAADLSLEVAAFAADQTVTPEAHEALVATVDYNDVPLDIEPFLANWGGAREKADLTASAAEERFSELLAEGWKSDREIEVAIRLAPFLPQPRERFFRDLLSAFRSIGKERCGELLVSLAPLISPEATRELADLLIEDGRASVGVKCLLAASEPAPARTTILASLRGDLEEIADVHEQEAALVAIVKSCSLDFVQALMSSWQPIRHIGDQRHLASLIFTFAPFAHGALDSGMFETFGDDGETQIKTLWRMMVDMSGAIKREALVDFVKEAASFSSEWWIVEALTLTILRVEGVDQIRAILQAIEHITASDLRARILGRIVVRLGRLGYRERALAAARGALSRLDEWRILSDAASDLASDGLLSTAAYFAAEICDAEEQSKARAAIALHAAARGHQAAACAITGTIRMPHWREMVMELLASSWRESGDPGDGWAVAEELPHRAVVEQSGIDWEVIRDLMQVLRERCQDCTELQAMSEAAEHRSTEKISRAGKTFWTARIGGGPTYLEILARQPRDLLALELRRLAPLLAISFAEQDAEEVIAAARDVSNWWP